MGLLKAGVGALSGVLADQWREYFYCRALPENVLVEKGEKRTTGRSANTGGSGNIITNGSIIAVNEGQCMMIVEQGAVVEFCAEAGEFVWDSSTEPTIFYGGFGEGLKKSWETLKKRFTMGGDPGKDQRVYFFNTKEIIGNKYGTANPVPFRVVDNNIGLDMDIGIKCFGEYSYRLTDPMLFYKNVCGNVENSFTRDKIDSQLKSELLTALQPAFAKDIRDGHPLQRPAGPYGRKLPAALNDVLSAKVEAGCAAYAVVIHRRDLGRRPPKRTRRRSRSCRRRAVFRNPNMAAATSGRRAGRGNEIRGRKQLGRCAMMAFAGLNMAQNAGGTQRGSEPVCNGTAAISARNNASAAAVSGRRPRQQTACRRKHGPVPCGHGQYGEVLHGNVQSRAPEAGCRLDVREMRNALNKGKFCIGVCRAEKAGRCASPVQMR